MHLNLLRKEAKERVKIELIEKGIGIYRNELNAEIKFNISGIKECINQPFNRYQDKVELIIFGLEKALIEAEYMGYTEYQTHPKEHVVGYHYFKTEIGGTTAYFNVQLTIQKKFFLYSITESINLDSLQKNT